jgi:ubiquinol-cytochrome c reductase cytochrome c1 subunit
MRRLLAVLLMILSLSVFAVPAHAATEALHPRPQDWQFDGVLGTFDKPAIQRGLQVFKEVCSSCHSLKRVPMRKLQEVGFSEAEVKSLAASYMVKDGPNDNGEMFERSGRPSDVIPPPYANEQAARAVNNGAYPLDLSLITKARHDGPNYVYSLLTGYKEAPAYLCTKLNRDGACIRFRRIKNEDAKSALEAMPRDSAQVRMGDVFYCSDIVKSTETTPRGKQRAIQTCTEMGKTMHYNPWFTGKQIAMAAPLRSEGQVEYQDKTKATVDQMAHDVVSFLQWAAEPEMEVRKRMGIRVILFLSVMTIFFYIAKKRIWRRVGH